ncbi:MAG: hypothetical protein L6Q95_01355 [Planctomycetes bacterium]|nr:hypothetical protein [Planctomycetota bacterium]
MFSSHRTRIAVVATFVVLVLVAACAKKLSEVGAANAIVTVNHAHAADGADIRAQGSVVVNHGAVAVSINVTVAEADCETDQVEIKFTFEANGETTPAAPTGGASEGTPATIGGGPVAVVGGTSLAEMQLDLGDVEVDDIEIVGYYRCVPGGTWVEFYRAKLSIT